MENKINITATGEKLLIGNDMIQLVDKSRQQFKTTDFDSFVSFIKKMGNAENSLFASETEIRLEPDKADRFTETVAICEMALDPRFGILRTLDAIQEFSIDGAEANLKRLKPYMDAKGVALLSNLQNFSVSKITNFEKRKEQNGDFVYQVSMESNGKKDFKPPEQIGFELPIFQAFPESKVGFIFDIYFNFANVGEDVSAKITFENLDFDRLVSEFKKKILKEKFGDLKFPFYLGSKSVTKDTDEELYLVNNIYPEN